MLSAHRISASPAAASKYYTVGHYYAKGADEPSEWRGEGAARLQLGAAQEGKDGVGSAALEKMLAGDLPKGERSSWRKPGHDDARHHPGWDFTLSAPKSASLAAILGGDERLIEAHREASRVAMSFLERYAGARIRDHGSVIHRATQNLIVASFTEFWSREHEAQLHEHNVVANMTYDNMAGMWRSVEGLSLYTALRTAGQVYQNEFATRVSERLGYDVAWNIERGTFEIEGVPERLIDQHSTRSKQIDDYAKEKGLEGVEGRERAALATRSRKSPASNRKLIESAKKRAGTDFEKLMAVTARANRRRETHSRKEQEASRNWKSADIARALRFGMAHATSGEAVVEEAEIIRHALQAGGPGVTLADIDKGLDRYKSNGRLITTTEQTGGRRIFHGRLLAKDIAVEQKFSHLISAGKGLLQPMLKEAIADRRLGAFRIRGKEGGKARAYPLSREQHAAAMKILTTKDRILHIQGVGGAGKSAMVGAVVKSTRLREHLAVAKTAVAAAGLGKEAGVPWMTADKFLSEGGSALSRGGVLYVDEATMLGTRGAARIDDLAAKNHFRVVVIGDAKQLPAIDQGKPHELAGRLGADVSELKHSRRHRTETVKQAVAAAREGKIATALDAIDRLHIHNVKDIAVAVARDWYQSTGRRNSKILALDNKTRVAVSEEVRRLLVLDGTVEKEGLNTTIYSVHVMTDAQKKIAEFYPARNAAITFHIGSKALGAERGATFDITGRKGDAIMLTREIERNGRKVTERLAWRPGRSSIRGVTVYGKQKREISGGDLIQWKRNDPTLDGIKNGIEGKVLSVKGAFAKIAFSDGKTRVIDLEKNPHWDHAYALTVYKAQGATYDRVFVVAPARAGPLLTQQTFYTALSRARDAIDLYTNDKKGLARNLKNAPGGKTSALEGMGKLPNGAGGPANEGPPPDLPPSRGPSGGVGERQAAPLPQSAAVSALDGAALLRNVAHRNEEGRRAGDFARDDIAARIQSITDPQRSERELPHRERDQEEQAPKAAGSAVRPAKSDGDIERIKSLEKGMQKEVEKEMAREMNRGDREISR